MRTLIGPSIVYNFQRSISAGLTLNLIFLLFIIADVFNGGSGWTSISSEFTGPAEALGSMVGAAIVILIAPIIYMPMGLIAAWVSRQIWQMPFNSIFEIGFKLIGAGLGWFALTCLIIMMLGDPGVLLLKRIAPNVVPVDRPKLWNPHLLITVQGDPEELRAAREQARLEQDYARQQREDDRRPRPTYAVEGGRGDYTTSSPSNDWADTISGVQSEALRSALAQANRFLDQATSLVHPINSIDERKAGEIEHLVARVQEQLTIARELNHTADEHGVADYIELLDAGAQQYAGIALALGQRRLNEGARLMETSVRRLEELGRRQGRDATSPQSLYLLGAIYLEMGDRGAALSYLRRASAAEPDNADYRQAVRQLENDISGAHDTAERRSGGGFARVALISILILVAGGGAFYLWQSSQRPVQADAALDPNHFEILPYAAQQTIVARESELNIRALPFARPDVPILRESIAGEVLNVTGLVNQADGPWYEVRLADGRTGYFKASLAVSQSEYMNSTAAGPPLTNGVYIQQGVCPFEGCIYRQWRATAATRLHREPNDNSDVIATVFAGETVTALTGEVHIIPLSGRVVRSLGEFRAGDTVYRLSYRGEGTWDVWYNGRIADAYNLDYWSENPVFDFGPNTGSATQSTWWVRIQRANGETGWSRETDNFEGKDQFG